MADELLRLRDAAEELGVHYMTAYRYLRPGRLHGVKRKGQWYVARADLEAVVAGRHTGDGSRGDAPARFLERLRAGDGQGAWELATTVIASGASAAEIHHRLVVPAVEEIRRLRAAGTLTTLEERRAIAAAATATARLGPMLRTATPSRGSVIVGAPSTDHASLEISILADLLRDDGFVVVDLGANTPPESFVEMIGSTVDLVAVAISSRLADPGPLDEAATAVRRHAPQVPLIVSPDIETALAEILRRAGDRAGAGSPPSPMRESAPDLGHDRGADDRRR